MRSVDRLSREIAPIASSVEGRAATLQSGRCASGWQPWIGVLDSRIDQLQTILAAAAS